MRKVFWLDLLLKISDLLFLHKQIFYIVSKSFSFYYLVLSTLGGRNNVIALFIFFKYWLRGWSSLFKLNQYYDDGFVVEKVG
ncbi:hypothetical protein HNQ88_003053 [Aureibacter tunicatorum]|uniref:Uncharacterized protein n=1 Tax=Aureibacter tunicatorum TaxID=866807 RepID=A0AAE3XP04_9BACT|nr:hypothetical protein [Aureibacter tunicatorum]BDD04477.1 hypothetical protein AUTU_19600 [Aureibacter tunicatorum]